MDCNKTSDTASHKSFIWRVKWIQIGFHWSIKVWIEKWWRAINQARAGDLLHQVRAMFCGLPQSTVQSLLLFTSIPPGWGTDRVMIPPALSSNPTRKAKQGPSPAGHTYLWLQPQLPALIFWSCHHGFGSKLLPFRSSLNTTFSAFCCPTHIKKQLLKGIMQGAVVSSSASGCLSDHGKARLDPFNAV